MTLSTLNFLQWLKPLPKIQDGMKDITGALEVEIVISQLTPDTLPVVQINTENGCVLRICRIEGEITINDYSLFKGDVNYIRHINDVVDNGDLTNGQDNSNVHKEPKK